ncbi:MULTISPECIES: hypothetical protein [Chryseobacterium]|uniref:Peptidase S24/S26A/S26B/S26C domain-containing protein n=1 Tax=Chryseobacterium geocarposphaerae TaxID=1416776 RepID=A0ABU1LCW9_9FLAO|nr:MULTISPECIES: hypothetical protein [Chryseobacterium]MDR6404572.1 hypothetical protein [Chryseobacterium geocarposphaerae]MDR6698196.1 hypothetical protein [Chryseobacterium ginsenosidimutans]
MNYEEKLKQPKGFFRVNLKEEIKTKVQYCIDNEIFYGLLSVKGDSMICDDRNKSIEDGNLVLVSELNIKNIYELGINGVPMRKPLCFLLNSDKGNQQLVCKILIFKDFVTNTFILGSYNPKYEPVYVPIRFIKKVFEVHAIIKE